MSNEIRDKVVRIYKQWQYSDAAKIEREVIYYGD